MRRVYKYPLQLVDRQEVQMPPYAMPLCVQVQNGVPCLWAIVNDEAAPKPLVVAIHGTGHPLDDMANSQSYVGTVQLEGGALVFHVFAWRGR